MSLSHRETRFIKIGGGAACVVLLYVLILLFSRGTGGGAAGAGTTTTPRQKFRELRANLREKARLQQTLDSLQEKLSAKAPTGNADEQRQKFVQQIEQTAGQSQAQLKSLTPAASQSRRSSSTLQPGDKIAYSVSLETQQQGLVQFLKALEKMEQPVVLTSLDIKADPNQPDKIQAGMELYTYIFDGWKP
jgi:hypothetical protein